MPVDNFGRMNDAKTIGDDVSLAYINNNFSRKDGTTTVTGSIDATGNTLFKVSNPVSKMLLQRTMQTISKEVVGLRENKMVPRQSKKI